MRTPRSYALNGENLAAGLLDGHVHIVKADAGVVLRDMDFGHDILSLSYEPSGEIGGLVPADSCLAEGREFHSRLVGPP